ncbi:MAG: hypothetical protein RML36_15720 [Anaerolineae bacterium]|nr:hypothetical protein [Anaerolineae bacterium]MDW8100921.1 hypothetical protein [Anaerolineae bacterium]
MKRLLNISTHRNDLTTIEHDWQNTRAFMVRNGFDGYELYPTDGYNCHTIPADIIVGLHLRFFVILDPIWRGDHHRLIEIFQARLTLSSDVNPE